MNVALQNQLKEEFEVALKDFESFSKTSKRKQIDQDQLFILFKKKLDFLKDSLNAFDFYQNELNNEDLKNVYIDAIPRYIDLLNTVPQKEPFLDIWYELKSGLNILLINLTNSPGKNDIWRYTSSANIVAHILTTLEPIHELPPLVNRFHPMYFEKIRISLNMISLSEKIYTLAISTLYTIPYKELCTWSSASFWHLHLLDKLLDHVHLPTFAKHYEDNIDYFYRSLYFNAQSRFSIFVLTFSLLKSLPKDRLTSFSTYDVISNVSISSLLLKIDELTSIMDNFESFVSAELHLSFISPNDHPDNSVWMNSFRSIYFSLKYFSKLIYSLNSQIFTSDINHSRLLVYDLVHSFISEKEKIKLALWSRGHDPIFIDLVKISMGLIGFIAIESKNINEFKIELTKLEVLQKDLSLNEFPEIYYFQELTKLWVFCSIGTLQDILESLDHLYVIKPHFINRSRDYATITILISILTYLKRNTECQQKAFTVLEELKEIILQDGNINHLKSDVFTYIEELKNLYSGKNIHSKFFCSRSKINILDPVSWVIPNFGKYFNIEDTDVSVFIPFNRYIDGIVS